MGVGNGALTYFLGRPAAETCGRETGFPAGPTAENRMRHRLEDPVADATRIPDDLKPIDGRFGSGPSKVRPEGGAQLNEVSTTFLGTSHRQATVKDQVARLRRGIAE